MEGALPSSVISWIRREAIPLRDSFFEVREIRELCDLDRVSPRHVRSANEIVDSFVKVGINKGEYDG